ncbi:MAG: hypothetical protein M1489_04985 [Firmicutes bacterium]|nr:hypothetical protein [Bacillota bacterium]
MSMVTRLLTNYQLEALSRQQIRAMERKHQIALAKLRKFTDKTNLPIAFNNNSVTSCGNFGLFETFKNAIGYDVSTKYIRPTMLNIISYFW